MLIAVNPASLLVSKMLKECFGIESNDLSIGAEVIVKTVLTDSFAEASGLYFDNDLGRFLQSPADALNLQMCELLSTAVKVKLTKARNPELV